MQADLIKIYTIGHGRHSFADFLNLLQKYEIEFLCDVRSIARSRWTQFNGAILSEELRKRIFTRKEYILGWIKSHKYYLHHFVTIP